MRPPPQQQQQQQPTVPAPPPGLPTLKQRVDAMRLAARFHLRRRRRHHPGSRSSSSFSFTSSMSKNHHHDHHNQKSHDTTTKTPPRTILPTTVTSLVRGCLLPRGGAHCRRAMNVDTGDKKEDHDGSWSGSRSSTTRSYQVLVKWLDNAFTTTNRKKTTIPTMISFLTGVDHQHDHHCHEMDHPPRPYSKVPVGEGLI